MVKFVLTYWGWDSKVSKWTYIRFLVLVGLSLTFLSQINGMITNNAFQIPFVSDGFSTQWFSQKFEGIETAQHCFIWLRREHQYFSLPDLILCEVKITQADKLVGKKLRHAQKNFAFDF